MRLRQVFRNQVATAFIDLLLFAYNSDAFSATGASRFENVHVFVVVEFPLIAPTLVVFGEKVGIWTYLEIFAMSPSLSLYVPPQVTLMSDVPGSCEVVDFLKRVHILEFTGAY